jgi:hypothetical protein
MERDMAITVERHGSGFFRAMKDGQKTKFYIINGSLGVSGHGRNMYGIVNEETEAVKWVGSLASCKKIVARWLT